MNIGFSFYGIIYGSGGRTGSDRDFRHCWPGLKRDLIDPFVAQGHNAKIFFSGYQIRDPQVEQEFYDTVKPDRVTFSHFANSDPFTAKFAAFNSFADDPSLDCVIFTRSDIHFSKIMAEQNIDWNKINFLFPEKGWWESHRFTCDNFYIIPREVFRQFRLAMEDTYAWPRGRPYVDTHGLWIKLHNYVDQQNFHLISEVPEISDINSFYTCCRSGLPIGEDRMEHLHPEVKDRFYNE